VHTYTTDIIIKCTVCNVNVRVIYIDYATL
jgi:hypothetical protein